MGGQTISSSTSLPEFLVVRFYLSQIVAELLRSIQNTAAVSDMFGYNLHCTEVVRDW